MDEPPPLSQAIGAMLALREDEMAAQAAGTTWCWSDLARLRDALQRELTGFGAATGLPIGVVLRTRPEHYAVLAAVLSLGHTLVAVNPELGARALVQEVRDRRLPVLIASGADWARVALDDTEVLGLAVADRPVPALLEVVCRPAELACPTRSPGAAMELRTSGTTGPPKRIQIGYVELLASIRSAQRHQSRPDGRAEHRPAVSLHTAPLSHMGGALSAVRALVEGHSLAMLERFTVPEWLELVRRHRPKVVNLVPAAMRMVLEADVPDDTFTSVRALVTGTAPCPPELALAFESRFGIPVLVNYGATEFNGGIAGWSLADHRAWADRKRGSVGRLHPGVDVRVIDEHGRELPRGAVGRLQVRATQIDDGSRWVPTSDVARLDEDGFLWVLGRDDAAITRGGFKVWPDDVRRVLEEHPAVREAVVVGLPDARLGQVPAAAVEVNVSPQQVDGTQLREFARERLAGYQCPVLVVVLDQLPRSAAMKPLEAEIRALLTQHRDGSG